MNPNPTIGDRITALPPLDASVAKLAKLVQDPDSSLGAFENVIRPDPALTANLLKLANSALYSSTTKVVSVRDAIARVGTRRVWETATAGAFGRTLPKVLSGYDVDAVGFWRHSVAVAVFAEAIARGAHLAAAPAAFTAGLLHDMGKLVIADFLAPERVELLDRLERGKLSMLAAEQELLGTDHAQVGEAVATRWGLPEELVAAARWHHEPLKAPDTRLQELAGAVHVANGLAHAMGFGCDIGGLHRRTDPAILARMQLDPSKLERLAANSLTEILELSRSLKAAGGPS